MSGLKIAQLVFSVLGIVAVLFIIVSLAKTALLARRGKALAERAVPYNQSPANATKNILVLGDSTGVGTGASSGAASVAGLIGVRYPRARVDNHSRNGARAAEVVALLPTTPAHYDAIVVLASGNDALHWTPLPQYEHDIAELLRRCKQRSSNVVLMPPGTFATAPVFPWPANLAFGSRSRAVRDVAARVAAETSVAYVDLLRTADQDPFAKDPATYYAADGFHPSDAGYADWVTQLAPTLERFLH